MQGIGKKGAAIRTIGFVVIALLLAGSLGTGQPAYAHGYACGGWIEYGDIVYDSVPSRGDCTYYFKGYRGDTVLIEMTKRTSSLDPFLTLYDPYGYMVASDDDTAGYGNSQIDVSLPRSGTYELVAGSYLGQSQGAYKLTLMGW